MGFFGNAQRAGSCDGEHLLSLYPMRRRFRGERTCVAGVHTGSIERHAGVVPLRCAKQFLVWIRGWCGSRLSAGSGEQLYA